MVSLLFKLRLVSVRLLGRFPGTEATEKHRQELANEHEEFNRFGQSETLKRYHELKAWFETGEHTKVKNELKALTYKASQEFQIEREYLTLCKNAALKNYLNLANTSIPQEYLDIESSGLPQEYHDLKEYLASPHYKSNRKKFKKENTEEYQKEIQFNGLKNSGELKKYFALKRSKALKDYFAIADSDTLKRYNQLKEQVESEEFRDRKAYLLSTDKFEKTETHQKLQEYHQLAKSDKITWYINTAKANKFKEIEGWRLMFEDDFTGKKLDRQKWLTKYFWGEALINNEYSLSGDRHCFTDEGNFEIGDSVLKIVTRKENAQGLAWDAKFGFIPRQFDYTSGLISTGNSYRQKHGRFEAKVKVSCTPGVYHAFWLVGDKMLPEVDVFRKKDNAPNSIQAAYFWQNGQSKTGRSITKIGGLKLDSGYYILGVEWDQDKILWTINGTPYKAQANNLPESPLYLIISSGVSGQTDDSKFPVTLEVDWVRCWSKAEG